MGGTFDPPHHAHLALAAAAHTELLLDRVIFVPAGDPWRKRDRDVSPAGARLEMVLAAVAPFSWAEVSSVEVDRTGASFTAETLEALVGPDEDWWFILGADALADMAGWYEPAQIIERARLEDPGDTSHCAPVIAILEFLELGGQPAWGRCLGRR